MKSVILSRLKECRESKQWTQETLAELAGVSVRTIQRTENGAAVSLVTANAIALAMDVHDVKQLMAPEVEVVASISQPTTENATTKQEAALAVHGTGTAQLSQDDAHFVSSFKKTYNTMGAIVLLGLMLKMIVMFPDAFIRIGYAGVFCAFILVLTKQKAEGVSWFKAWNFNPHVLALSVASFGIFVSVNLFLALGGGFLELRNSASALQSKMIASEVSDAIRDDINALDGDGKQATLKEMNFNDWLDGKPGIQEKFEMLNSMTIDEKEYLNESCVLKIDSKTTLHFAYELLSDVYYNCETKEPRKHNGPAFPLSPFQGMLSAL